MICSTPSTTLVDPRSLHHIQLDALCEVANMGAGHAATALSQMTSSKIVIGVPHLQIVEMEELPELLSNADEMVAAVSMHMLGDLTGRTLLLFPRDSALRLSEILLRRGYGTSTVFGELEKSAVKEAGNIICSAYMNALADFMGMMLLPSVPNLVVDLCAAVLTTTNVGIPTEPRWVFSIETQFMIEDAERPVDGHFLLMPDIVALDKILRAVRLA
jgi:chemotaxis protein CheC